MKPIHTVQKDWPWASGWIHSQSWYSKDCFAFLPHFGVRRCWKISLIFSFQAFQNNNTVKAFWCILMPKAIDVVKAGTGRNSEKLSLIHLIAIAPKLFSGTLCTEGFKSQAYFSSEISLHRRSEKGNNDVCNVFFWSAVLETVLQSEMKDVLRPVWILGCLWQLHCCTQVFISFSSLVMTWMGITENSKEKYISSLKKTNQAKEKSHLWHQFCSANKDN